MATVPINRIDPIFPVTNLTLSTSHYRALGFTITQATPEYAFASFPNSGTIHLSLVSSSSYDGKTMAAAAYLYVDDAQTLLQRWKEACPDADIREAVRTDYGMWEGAHLDPDNNLIRVGSKIREREGEQK